MADTEDMAPARATTPARRTSGTAARPRKRAKTAHLEADTLEADIKQLQADIRSITSTLGRMGQNTVSDVRSTAKQRAHELADRGQSAIESAQDEFGAFEKQIKDTIRDKPLTAVAGAVALGFLIAVITR